MGTVSVSLPSDGETIEAADYNTPINTIVNEINGNLDNANIDASAAIAGSKLATSSVTSTQINFGGSGAGIWWEEIGRTTLGSAGDTITVSSFGARKYLKVLISAINTGGTISGAMTLNSDSGNNYTLSVSSDFDVKATTVSQASINVFGTAAAAPRFGTLDIVNIAAQEKLFIANVLYQNTAGAANAPGTREFFGKWANTSDQITTITLTNAGTGDFAIGSEIVVLGHD